MTYLQARIYDDGNFPQDVLLEARDISFNDAACTLSFPENDPSNAYFKNEVQVGIEIEEFAGVTYGSEISTVPLVYTASGEVETRFQYEKAAGSAILKDGLWKYTLPAYNVVNFPDCPVSKDRGHVLKFGPTDTPYTVMATRVAEAQARGMLLGVTVVDGGGWTTPNFATNLEFENHSALDEFYKALKDGNEADLYWVGLTLYMYAPGTMTVDRSDSVKFQDVDFSDLPVELDFSNKAQSIIVVGDKGSYVEHPSTLPGRTKRVQASGVTDGPTLLLIAQRQLAARQKPLRQITASLALAASPDYLPYRDYHRGAIVEFPTEDGDVEGIKVAGITITRGIDPDFSGNLVLDTKIKSDEVRRIEQGKIAVNGITTLSGTGRLATTEIESDWTLITNFFTGFASTSAYGWGPVSVRRFGNRVRLHGAFTRNAAAGPVAAFAVPAAFIPSAFAPGGGSPESQIMFLANGIAGAIYTLQIGADGVVSVAASVPNHPFVIDADYYLD